MAKPEEVKSAEPKLKKVYSLCPKCKGAKEYFLPLGYVPCDKCDATGVIHTGYIEV